MSDLKSVGIKCEKLKMGFALQNPLCASENDMFQ